MIPTGLPDLSKPSRVQKSIRTPEFLSPIFYIQFWNFRFWFSYEFPIFLFWASRDGPDGQYWRLVRALYWMHGFSNGQDKILEGLRPWAGCTSCRRRTTKTGQIQNNKDLRWKSNSRANFSVLYKKFGLKNSGFLMDFLTLDGLERSGRPVGIISTYFRQNPTGGFRAMTKNTPNCTTIKCTSIKVWAYKDL